MKNFLPRLCAGLIGALLLSQCAATPQSRISRNPQIYGELSARDQQSVANGMIREGMTRDAVYLAWGRPDRVSVGSNRGRKIESWTYVGQRPVSTMNVGMGFGWGGGPFWGGGPLGWGGYGWGGYPYWGGGPSVTYIPYTQGVVEFTSGRVTKWLNTPR